MTLNSSRFTAKTAFNNVRINCSLRQIVNSADFLSFFFKNTDEFFADNFTFAFRSAYAFQLAIEAFTSIYADEVAVKLTAFTEYRANFLTFIFAQQAMINEHAGQLFADGFSQHSSANAGVNPAG